MEHLEHRTHFMDYSLLYLFSASIEFSLAIEQVGLGATGARVNVICVAESSRVFNILHERGEGPEGYAAVTGALVSGMDIGLIREDDIAIAGVQALIRTDDGALIEAEYPGVLPLGVGAFRNVVAGVELFGTDTNPAELTIIVTPNYVTADPKYRWLNEQQCIGFGRVEASMGLFRRVSYDVYALA